MHTPAPNNGSPGVSASSAKGRWLIASAVLGSGVAFLDGTVVNVAVNFPDQPTPAQNLLLGN